MSTPHASPGPGVGAPAESDEEQAAEPLVEEPEAEPGGESDDSDVLIEAAADDTPADEPELAAVAPPVVAVLVTSDPGPWLEDAVRSLGEQDYPALSVLVLDNGSAEDPTARIADAMPGAFVRRLDQNLGFAAAANDVMTMVEGATFLLFCHDDIVLEPDAVRVMVEEAYRSNAAIVGPKLVDYDRPEMLLEVGMAIDHYAVPFSNIEPGELDQEQHDAVRDVFYVSNATMLVRADLFHEIGGFDAATFPGSDDIDLCWRARLAGARVLVAPDARVRHRRTTIEDDRAPRNIALDNLKIWTCARLRVLLKCYSALALIWIIPTALFLNVIEALGLLFTGRPRRAGALLAGWLSVFRHPGELRRARSTVQHARRVDDGDVRDLMVRGSARLRTFTVQRLHAGDRITDISQRTKVAASRARGSARRTHVVMTIALIVLILFGTRLFVLDRVPAVGMFQEWPGVGSLWSTYFDSWRYTMMGSATSASPVFAFMASLSTVLLGDTDLARTLLIAGALPLGAFGAYRLARPMASSAAPAVVAAVAYAVNPVARNAIAEGQLGPLVLFAFAPFIMAAVVRAGVRDVDRRTRVHPVLTVTLLLALVTAFWPSALLFALVAAVGFALAALFVGGWPRVGRTFAVAGIATAGAFVLCAPWTLSLIGADAATLGVLSRAAPSLADVLSFDTGGANTGAASFGLLIAAALPLAVARGSRLVWAARAWMVAIVSFALAWLPGRLDHGNVALEGVLVPAALGLSLAAGLGAAAFLEELRTFHFGLRQVAPVAAAVGLLFASVGFVFDTWQGRWGAPGTDWSARLAWIDNDVEPGGFRLLWIGDPEILPVDAKVVDGVGFALTRDGTGDVRADWAAPEHDADEVIADAIELTRNGQTARLGHIVAPAGVRYVVYVERAAPGKGAFGAPDPELEAALGQQLDLAVSRLERGATLYENAAWAPRRATVPAGTDIHTDAEDPVTAAQSTSLSGATGVDGTVGPGALLWAEAADGRWHASVDGERVPHGNAFGWTNAYAVDTAGDLDVSFDASLRRRVGPWIELVLWIAALVGWRITRVRKKAEAA